VLPFLLFLVLLHHNDRFPGELGTSGCSWFLPPLVTSSRLHHYYDLIVFRAMPDFLQAMVVVCKMTKQWSAQRPTVLSKFNPQLPSTTKSCPTRKVFVQTQAHLLSIFHTRYIHSLLSYFPPAGSVTDDDDRYQRSLLVWPPTLRVDGPVITQVVLWRFWNWNRNRGFNPKPNGNRNLQILRDN